MSQCRATPNIIANVTTANSNVTNFIRVLSVLDTIYNCWTEDSREAYGVSVNPNTTQSDQDDINSLFGEFSKYNRLMKEALGYWSAMSLDEQTNLRLVLILMILLEI